MVNLAERIGQPLFERLAAPIARRQGGGRSALQILQSKGADFFYHDFIARTDLTFQDAGGLTAADDSGEAVALAFGADQIGGTGLSSVLASATELVEDGTFSLGISQVVAARSAVLSWDGSARLKVEYGGIGEPQGRIALATTAGVPIKITFDVVLGGNNAVVRSYASDGSTSLGATGTVIPTQTGGLVVTPTGSVSYLSLGGSFASANFVLFDNVSAKEVAGYHAIQTGSTGFRPTRQADGGLKGDGLDDALRQRLASSTSMCLMMGFLGGANPASLGALIGGPVGTARGYLARDSAGKLCAGVGTDGPTTIVGGGDLSGVKGVAILNVAASGDVDLEWMPKGGVLTSLYSAPVAGAIGAGTAMRLFATNASGTAGNFGADNAYFAMGIQTTLTPAERLAIAKEWNARIPS